MSDIFAFTQKLILVTILGWLGLQFAPSDADRSDKDDSDARASIVSMLN